MYLWTSLWNLEKGAAIVGVGYRMEKWDDMLSALKAQKWKRKKCQENNCSLLLYCKSRKIFTKWWHI